MIVSFVISSKTYRAANWTTMVATENWKKRARNFEWLLRPCQYLLRNQQLRVQSMVGYTLLGEHG